MKNTNKEAIIHKDEASTGSFRATVEKANNLDGQQDSTDWLAAKFKGRKNPFRANHGFIDSYKPPVIPGWHSCGVPESLIPDYLSMGFEIYVGGQHVEDERAGRASRMGTAGTFGKDKLVTMVIPIEWHKENDAQILAQINKHEDYVYGRKKITTADTDDQRFIEQTVTAREL